MIWYRVFAILTVVIVCLGSAQADYIVIETEDISKPASSGLYSDYATRDIYYYDSSTGALTLTGTKVPPRQSTNESDGQCHYSADLFTEPSHQIAGRCIGLRPVSGGTSMIRIGIREVQTQPMKGTLVHSYHDVNGEETGTLSWIYPCSGFDGQSAPVKNCQVENSSPRTVTAQADEIPGDSTTFCSTLRLYIWDGSDFGDPVLEVIGQCKSL